ncbi:MAG: hypothetical protein ACYSX0_01575 [Planctomycetota bacterium]|jgi:hypothetical protein
MDLFTLLTGLEPWETALLGGALLVAVTLLAVYFAILRNLPENLMTSPADEEDVPWELDEIANEYMLAGFERFGLPLRIHLNPEAIMLPLIHRAEGAFATVYRIAAQPPRIAYDVVSICDAEQSALTTAMDHGAGVLPAPDGGFRQIFQRCSVTELLQHHREGMEFLEQEGLKKRRAEPEKFGELLRLSFVLQRHVFLKARLKHTLLALVRTVTKRNPYLGALREQSGISEQLGAVRRRAAGIPDPSERDEELLLTRS